MPGRRGGATRTPEMSPMIAQDGPESAERTPEPVRAPDGVLRRRWRSTNAEAQQSIAMLYIVLPYPPAVNNLYATYRGRRIKSARGRAYETECGMAVVAAVEPTEPLPLPPFCLVIHAYVPDLRRRDIDGLLKAPIDNVFRALKDDDYAVDDSMIDEMHVYKALDRKRPRLELLLSQHRVMTTSDDALLAGRRREG